MASPHAQPREAAAPAAESCPRLAARPQARHGTLPSLSFPSRPRASTRCRGRSGTVGCLSFPHVQPWAASPLAVPGASGTLPSMAGLGRSGSQHLTSQGAKPWQGEGAAYAEQMESIKTKGSRPASIYYPSKGLKCIYRHPEPYGEGEPPPGATLAGRERQGQPCPRCSHATSRPFASLCPWAAPPSPRLGSQGPPPKLSQLASPLHCTPSPSLRTAPVPSHPPVRDDATEHPGHVERREDEERAPAPARNSQPLQHHLHGHCRCSGSTVEDPAAGSSPRCRGNSICACFLRAAAPADGVPELQAAPRLSLSLTSSWKR